MQDFTSTTYVISLPTETLHHYPKLAFDCIGFLDVALHDERKKIFTRVHYMGGGGGEGRPVVKIIQKTLSNQTP